MKQKMKQLMGILISLVMVLEGAGGLTVCAAEQTEPNAIEQRLQIDDVIYYNAKSRSFASSTQQFYYDLLSAPVDDSKYGWAYQFSRAELWMYLALCLDPGCPDRDFLYMESEIRGHKLSPLKYIYNNGKDEFYTGIWYNGRHYDVVFRNLGIVALQPDASVKGNYISTTIDSSKSGGTHVSSVRNESNSYVTQTIDDSESVTVTMSNSVNGSESYSYTEGIKVGYEYDGIFNNVSAEISFSATQALQNGWSKSNTESKTYTNGTSNTRTVPPYSAAVMETGSSDIEVTTRYNCPVGLTYSVDILTGGTNDWNPDTDPNATTWNGKKYTFGPDARKDIYQRWLINGNSSTNVDREKIDWRWVGYGRRDISDNQWLIDPLSKYVPVSSAGAVIRETKKSTKTTCKEFVPLHPLKTIKIETPPDGTAIAGKISYDSYDYLQMSLPMGKSSNTRYFTLGGYNSQGGIFSTFNKDFGHWIVVDENGRELGGDAPVTLDSATGKFTAASPGKCYLKYLIDEDKYVSADTGERYLTNRDIDKPAIMEITVEEPEYTNKLEITGSYTGIVGVASESIEGDGKLQGAVLDETDAEVEEPYIWKARQLPSRGINLTEDGMVSFTKPGTFQVRIMTPDKKHYSEWYDVTAKRGDDSSYIIIDDDDLPPVIDDEDYRIADESAVIFVEGSFDGSANGEAVSLEGKDKLTVYAEDLSGQELPIKYEWEQMENEGLVLSKDGKAVFTKPGNYFVRVRSGEIYSDWVEITAKVPAEVKRAPVAIDRVFDGRTRNLVEPGVAVGGKIAYVVMIDPWSVPSEASFEEEWASEIPAATDAGTYYVWYKVVGDDNHNGTTPACVTVTVATAYPLWVGGAQVTSANAVNITGGETVTASYDADSKTLTLNNYSYSGEGYTITEGELTSHYAVLYDDTEPMNIVLSGENSLACAGADDHVYFGIRSNGNLTISGSGSASVNGKSTGIIIGSIDIPANLDIAGGSVTVRQTNGNAFEVYGGIRIGKGAGTVVADTTDPYDSGIYVYGSDGLAVNGGSLTATGGKAGIKAQNGPVVIGNNCAVVATGDTNAIDSTVKNTIAGTGWTNTEGTDGKTAISESTTGQTLDNYKKVQFPGLPAATVTTAPTAAKDLTYNGQAQELVTAGTAEGGTMHYAISKDNTTAPTDGWTNDPTTIKATNVGTYYVWYKVIGDENHKDTEATSVTVTVNEEKTSAPAETPAKSTVVSQNTAKEKKLSINSKYKVSQKGSKVVITYGKVSGADQYVVYGGYCGQKSKKLKTVKAGAPAKAKITKINGKKLDLTKNFKFNVVAYKKVNGKKAKLCKTITAHIVGSENTEFTNIKKIKLKTKKMSLKVGKSRKIKAELVLVDPGKKMLSAKHAPKYRYDTSDSKVATVSKKGKVTARGKGKCYIWVYAKNGYAKKVSVTVK